MSRFTFATGTVGGSIATRELAEKTAWKRRMNGEFVYPVVRLADKHMNTRFGGRQRPHFEIVRWTSFGTGNGALAAPQQSALAAPAKNVWEQFTEAEAVKPAQPGAVLHDDDLNWKALISKKDSKRLSA